MASAATLRQLQELQPNSGQHVRDSIITGMTHSLTRARYQLMHTVSNPRGAGFLTLPRVQESAIPQNNQAQRRLMVLAKGRDGNFTHSLNTALLGGESYPILNFALGTALGPVSASAALIFSVATTALSLTQRAQRVLAREGDELWQVEEIGRRGSQIVHVGAYFLNDPYRNRDFSVGNGWLIHEERHVLDV